MQKTVLIVDDSPYCQKLLAAFFTEKLNFTILGTGKNGHEAVELYRKLKPDLITMDISMPNMAGDAATKQILAEFPEARILMVTAVRGQETEVCIQHGARGSIYKPLKFENPEFAERFAAAVEGIFSVGR